MHKALKGLYKGGKHSKPFSTFTDWCLLCAKCLHLPEAYATLHGIGQCRDHSDVWK